ncbi:MAG: competence/damage-inducible protein A [Gammaproteobacteria bacterium]|nr:competence/damage-inducible protein A [Gammaproteobacteria bacterium]NIM72000.1 competence/damage-inducible protein A [Gammaproteobacteria bacterium]NIN38408.1 competence/damage-inducible protein A [Gammaproteobacteria bacterium]NIO23727.1 competence/damage-inducible protein A [Gammaproteobacteria bacterium]NIO64369.1 competence/damage-inducible protein A [Gammaproteobacteria bacterium]
MPIGLIIIGTELLIGKRRDSHFAHAIEALGRRALVLAWCRYVADDARAITRELRFAMEEDAIVFCFGGIGATPDDHTRASAARAAGVELVRHPEAAAIIEARFGEGAYPQRIHMADLPRGCTLIPNPVNQIAGFSLGRLHFVPGFPQMAWPMMEWVLDHHYPELHGREAPVEALVTLPGTSEGQLIGIMQELVKRFPDVDLSCLPHMSGDYRETELGVRGSAAAVETAALWLTAELDRTGLHWERRAATRAEGAA